QQAWALTLAREHGARFLRFATRHGLARCHQSQYCSTSCRPGTNRTPTSALIFISDATFGLEAVAPRATSLAHPSYSGGKPSSLRKTLYFSAAASIRRSMA